MRVAGRLQPPAFNLLPTGLNVAAVQWNPDLPADSSAASSDIGQLRIRHSPSFEDSRQ